MTGSMFRRDALSAELADAGPDAAGDRRRPSPTRDTPSAVRHPRTAQGEQGHRRVGADRGKAWIASIAQALFTDDAGR